jgi:hypothetical protein
MAFLRSEVHVMRWLEGNGWDAGAGMSATKLHELATAWWSTRLDPQWRPRTVAESQAILEGLGLTGPFWQLA